MPKVYANVPGAVYALHLSRADGGGTHTASETDPAVLPESVAQGLEWEMAGCPVNEEGERDLGGKPSREPHSQYRIERDGQAPRLASKKPPKAEKVEG